MKKLLLLLALLWSPTAVAQVTQGPLLIQRNLGEIADQGSAVQAAARANLGIAGSVAIPTAPLLGGSGGVYTSVTLDSTLTLSINNVLGANVGTSGATIPTNNGGFTQSGTANFTGPLQIIGNAMTFPTSPSVLAYVIGSVINGDCATWSGTAGGLVDSGAPCGGGGGGGGGTVTSVALTAPAFLSVAGSPITGGGTIGLTLANQAAHAIFAGSSTTGSVAPTFRAMVSADLPSPLTGLTINNSTIVGATITTPIFTTTSTTITTLASGLAALQASANQGIINDTVNAVTAVTVGSGVPPEGYEVTLNWPNGGFFDPSGAVVAPYNTLIPPGGNITLQIRNGNWQIVGHS